MGLHVEKYHVVLWPTQSTTQKQAQHKLKIQFFWTNFSINQSINQSILEAFKTPEHSTVLQCQQPTH